MNDLPINQPANPNSMPGYHVPTANLSKINHPDRWKRWVGANVIAFFMASFLFPGLFLAVSLALVYVEDRSPSLLNQFSLDARGPLGIIGYGFLSAITTIPIALIQRIALDSSIPRWSWVTKTALSVGVLMPTSTFLAHFMLGNLLSSNTSEFIVMGYLFIIFGITAFGTALIQGLEIKPVATDPLQWVWASSLTWIILSCIILSVLFSLSKIIFPPIKQ
ncbi:hypothetical protein [Herpetosiphon gulosus]|uniref:Yip1 domain-containing protein n=1 Tax=Herpetosiphon gulosus TaxID=1973496 RepID=A0ABP9WZ90_9CHLR